MAQITLAPGSAQVDGSPANIAGFLDRYFDPDDPATSLAERNGALDAGNLGENLEYRSFRLGSASLGGTVVNKRPWDYFAASYYVPPAATKWRYVPGMGVQIYLPWTGRVLLSWSCAYRADLEYTNAAPPEWFLRLFVNDVAQDQHMRLPQYWDGTVAGRDPTMRKWTSFAVIDSLAGETWHNVGIKFANGNVRTLFRLYRSSFTWVALKQA